MRRLFGLFFVFLFSAAGCKSTSGFDELSDGEKEMLVENARVIFVKSGKSENLSFEEKLKIAESKDKNKKKPVARPFAMEEKFIVKRTKPEMRFYYTGDKEGRATITWKLSRTKSVALIATGKLIEKDKMWNMSVVNSEDLIVTPDARKTLERSGSTLIEDLKAGKSFPAAQ